MSKNICRGTGPWECPLKEVRACLELHQLGLLPTGPESAKINVVALLATIRSRREPSINEATPLPELGEGIAY